MEIAGTQVEDTFAEAFRMRYVRLVVTAHDEHWLDAAVREFCGYSTSIIACDAETGVERPLPPAETPDGRSGVPRSWCSAFPPTLWRPPCRIGPVNA